MSHIHVSNKDTDYMVQNYIFANKLGINQLIKSINKSHKMLQKL